MRKYLLFLFVVSFYTSYSQSSFVGLTDSINVTDNNGMKQGRWVINNKNHKLANCPDASKVEEGEYRDSKKIGTWKSYYCNGKVKNELIYANGRPSGFAKFYYENGVLEEEGMWENNRWVGQYKRYHENGQLSQEFKYNAAGTREGTQKYYYENGKVMIEGDWKDGKEAGILKEYYEDGSIRAEKNFAGGVLDASTSKSYDAPNGSSPPNTNTGGDLPAKVEKTEPTKTEPNTPANNNTQKVSPPVANDKNIGVISDGFHKTYTRSKQVEKEGTFKDGILWEGKIYSYEGEKLVKTMIIKGGKTESVQVEK